MCGIMGWSFNQNCTLTMRQRATMLQLAAFGADKRGGQSWGILTVDHAKPAISKGLGALVQRNFRKVARHPLGFAHSRFATKGGITVENCHPFEIGSIIGAHNGVLSNSWQLDTEFGDEPVDSRHIFKAIDAGRDLKDLEGYGVIEFYDRKYANTIMLADIGRGSITLFALPHDEGYFWTSVKEDGELALEAVGADKGAVILNLKKGRTYAIVPNEEVYETELKLELGSSYTASYPMGTPWEVKGDEYEAVSYNTWRGKSTYDGKTGKWTNDGDSESLVEAAMGMTKKEKAELREELKASWTAEEEARKKDLEEEVTGEYPAAGFKLEKEWQIGEKKEEKEKDAEEEDKLQRLIVAC